jgi:hypothetical protein
MFGVLSLYSAGRNIVFSSLCLQANFGAVRLNIAINVAISVQRLTETTTCSDFRGSVANGLGLDSRIVIIEKILDGTTGQVLATFALNDPCNSVQGNGGVSGARGLRAVGESADSYRMLQSGGVKVQTAIVTSGLDGVTANASAVANLAASIQNTSTTNLMQSFIDNSGAYLGVSVSNLVAEAPVIIAPTATPSAAATASGTVRPTRSATRTASASPSFGAVVASPSTSASALPAALANSTGFVSFNFAISQRIDVGRLTEAQTLADLRASVAKSLNLAERSVFVRQVVDLSSGSVLATFKPSDAGNTLAGYSSSGSRRLALRGLQIATGVRVDMQIALNDIVDGEYNSTAATALSQRIAASTPTALLSDFIAANGVYLDLSVANVNVGTAVVNAPAASATATPSTSTGLNTAAIIGGVIGGFAFVVIVGLVLYLVFRKKDVSATNSTAPAETLKVAAGEAGYDHYGDGAAAGGVNEPPSERAAFEPKQVNVRQARGSNAIVPADV